MRSVAMVFFLLFFVCEAFAQSEPAHSYSVGGVVIMPHLESHSEIEVGLLNESEIPVGKIFTRPQEQFSIPNLPAGRYYIVMNVPGFRPVRQRVDAVAVGSAPSVPVFLMPVEEPVAKKPLDLTGDNTSIDVSQLQPRGKAPKHLDDAEKKLRSGKLSDARTQLEAIVRSSPDSYDAHRLLGEAYEQSHRYPDAEREYRAARGFEPRSAVPLVNLAGLFLVEIENNVVPPDAKDDLRNEAQTLLIQAVQLKPDASFAHYLLGVTYFQTSMSREAEIQFKRSLELEPGLGTARLGLASLYSRSQNWPAAMTELDAYLRDNPHASDRDSIRVKRAEIDRLLSSAALQVARDQPAEPALNSVPAVQ